MEDLVEVVVDKVIRQDYYNLLIIHEKNKKDSIAAIQINNDSAESIQMELDGCRVGNDIFDFFRTVGFKYFDTEIKKIIIKPDEKSKSSYNSEYGIEYNYWKASIIFKNNYSEDARPSDALRLGDIKNTPILIPKNSLQPKSEIKLGDQKFNYKESLEKLNNLEKITKPGKPLKVNQIHFGTYEHKDGTSERAAVLLTSKGMVPLSITKDQWRFYETANSGEIGLFERPDTYFLCSRILNHFNASFKRITASSALQQNYSYYHNSESLPLFSEGPVILKCPKKNDLKTRMLTIEALILNKRGIKFSVNVGGFLRKTFRYIDKNEKGEGFHIYRGYDVLEQTELRYII